jgi:septum formation protein
MTRERLMSSTLILASSSPRRRELLTSLGIPFTIIKPDIDETQHPGEPPLDYVRRLSREKAAAVANTLNSRDDIYVVRDHQPDQHIVLAADTVVILGADTLGVDEHGDILGKPTDPDEARAMLHSLRGRTHQVCTAITLHTVGTRHVVSAEPLTRVTITNVTMRDYADAEIDAYIGTGDPFDKAGSYAIQHPIFHPVAHIDGCYTNVVGLPVCTLKNMLAEIGWSGIERVEGCDCRSSNLPFTSF